MIKRIKRIALACVVLLMVAVVGGAIVLLTFDPQIYLDRVVQHVKQRYDRELTVSGEFEVSIFPRLGLRVTDVSLSNPLSLQEQRDQCSATPFVTMEELTLSVALWPLLFDRFLIERVQVNGFSAHLVRYADGRLNIEDIYAPSMGVATDLTDAEVPSSVNLAIEEQAAQAAGSENAFHIDIAGVELLDGQLHLEDQLHGRVVSLHNVSLFTGQIAAQEPFAISATGQIETGHPEDKASFSLKGNVTLQPDAWLYRVNRLVASVQGQLQGYTIDQANLTGQFAFDKLSGELTGQQTDLSLRLQRPGEDNVPLRTLRAQIQSDALSINQQSQSILVKQLSSQGQWQDEQIAQMHWDVEAPELLLSPFEASTAPVTAQLTLRPRSTAPSDTAQATTSRSVASRGDDLESLDKLQVSVRLEGLRGALADLQVQRGELTGQYTDAEGRGVAVTLSTPMHANVWARQWQWLDVDSALELLSKASEHKSLQDIPSKARQFNFAGQAQLAQERIDVEIKDGQVFGGDIKATGHYDLDNAQWHVATHLRQLELSQLGALPLALETNHDGQGARAAKARPVTPLSLSGRGDLRMDLRAQGLSWPDIRQAAEGSVQLTAQDGLLHGMDIQALVDELIQERDAESPPLLTQPLASSVTQAPHTPSLAPARTAFDDLALEARVGDGLLHLDDFELQSKHLRLQRGTQALNAWYDLSRHDVFLPLVVSWQQPMSIRQGGVQVHTRQGTSASVILRTRQGAVVVE